MSSRITKVREISCGWLVNQLARRMNDSMNSELQAHELDVRHFATLMSLLERDGLTQTQLARRVGSPPYAMSRVIDAFEDRQLVRRRPDPDSRRAHRIFLTANGQSFEKVLPPIVKRVNEQVLSRLDRSEQRELVRLLRKALDV